MKLIDLLVQELPVRGGWPKEALTIAQDIGGAVYGYKCNRPYTSGGMWRSVSGNGLLSSSIFRYAGLADYRMDSFVTREQYETALAASQQSAWSGEGLPPVGCECEAYDGLQWYPSVVVAHYDGFAFAWNYDKRITFTVNEINADQFRPARTEADLKRDEAIDGMISSCTNFNKTDVMHAAVEIYDAIASGKIPHIKLETK